MLRRNTFGCEGGGALVPTRGDSPSPRPFFHHVRGDLYIKALFWVAKASETTISLTYPFLTRPTNNVAYRNNTLFRINMRSLVSLSQKYTSINRYELLQNRSLQTPTLIRFSLFVGDSGPGSRGGYIPRLVQRAEGGQTIVETTVQREARDRRVFRRIVLQLSSHKLRIRRRILVGPFFGYPKFRRRLDGILPRIRRTGPQFRGPGSRDRVGRAALWQLPRRRRRPVQPAVQERAGHLWHPRRRWFFVFGRLLGPRLRDIRCPRIVGVRLSSSRDQPFVHVGIRLQSTGFVDGHGSHPVDPLHLTELRGQRGFGNRFQLSWKRILELQPSSLLLLLLLLPRRFVPEQPVRLYRYLVRLLYPDILGILSFRDLCPSLRFLS